MYSLKVNSITREHSQSDNSDYLKVDFAITDTTTNGVVDQRSQAFGLGFSKEQLEAELQKILTTYTTERQQAVANAAQEAAAANADTLIQEFQGKQITLTESVNMGEVPVSEAPAQPEEGQG